MLRLGLGVQQCRAGYLGHYLDKLNLANLGVSVCVDCPKDRCVLRVKTGTGFEWSCTGSIVQLVYGKTKQQTTFVRHLLEQKGSHVVLGFEAATGHEAAQGLLLPAHPGA